MTEQTMNFMKLQFASRSENESFARVTVASFISQLDPTLDELQDIKTVVSEVVTNSIIHGYNNNPNGIITIYVEIQENRVELTIEDKGVGITDLDMARQPLWTSKPELERSGMGFTIMENFMDSVEILTAEGKGTRIHMKKQLKQTMPLCN